MYHAPVPARNTPPGGVPPQVEGGVPGVPATVTVPVTVTGGDKDDVGQHDTHADATRPGFTARGHGRPRERLRAARRYAGPGSPPEAAGDGTEARDEGTHEGRTGGTRHARGCEYRGNRVSSRHGCGWSGRWRCNRRGDGRGGGGARRAQATHGQAKPHPARQPQRREAKRVGARSGRSIRRIGPTRCRDWRRDRPIWQRIGTGQHGFDRERPISDRVRISTDPRIGSISRSGQRIWIGDRRIWLVDLARSGQEAARIWRVGRLDPQRIGRSGLRIWASPFRLAPDPQAGSAAVRRRQQRIGPDQPDPAARVEARSALGRASGDRTSPADRTRLASRWADPSRRRHEASAARGDPKRTARSSTRGTTTGPRRRQGVQQPGSARVASPGASSVGGRVARHRCRVDVLFEPRAWAGLARVVERSRSHLAQGTRQMVEEQQARQGRCGCGTRDPGNSGVDSNTSGHPGRRSYSNRAEWRRR